jgi:hypothetical protein
MGFSPAESQRKETPVSPTVLADLADELGADAATRFVHAFADLWPVRRLRIHAAICAQDPAAAMDAVLSLRSGASMAGATPLAEHTELIRTTLLSPHAPAWAHAHALLPAMDELGEGTVRMLRASVATWPARRGTKN